MMMTDFSYLRSSGISRFRAVCIITRRAWLSRQARKAREVRQAKLGAPDGKSESDTARIVAAHRGALRTHLEGCLVFLATLSLILIACIIAGLR